MADVVGGGATSPKCLAAKRQINGSLCQAGGSNKFSSKDPPKRRGPDVFFRILQDAGHHGPVFVRVGEEFFLSYYTKNLKFRSHEKQ